MKFFLICSVRGATPEDRAMQDRWVSEREAKGHIVHWPPRDTKQESMDGGYSICRDNREAIRACDCVAILYNPASTGTHFDMGVAFAMDKPVLIIGELGNKDNGKSFPNMLKTWSNKTAQEENENGI